MTDKDLYGGLIRLHILHHAAKESVFGLGLIQELRHHGYEISAGTLCSMLHGMEKKGYLSSHSERTGQRGDVFMTSQRKAGVHSSMHAQRSGNYLGS